MAVRTSSSAVIAILGAAYPSEGTLPSLTGFILTASRIVDRVATCATAKGITLDSEELELIERWLAAHYYLKSDRPAASESTLGASISYAGDGSKAFLETAQDLDYSGCLKAIMTRAFARVKWLGKAPSDQTDYAQRD